jgi:5-methylcytosine-specific restriction enzyme subunit McrC
MSDRSPQIIRLTEYEPAYFEPEVIPEAAGALLWEHYSRQVAVEFPNPTTGYRWRLTAQGWVGHLPLTPELHLVLQPKVPLTNLFRMLEVAYRLELTLLPGLVHSQALTDFYERLALLLARRVLERGRLGFYRTYVGHSDSLPYLRGRLELAPAQVKPGQVGLACHYEEHTADIADNQILSWTLWHIMAGGRCGPQTLASLRRAFQALQGLTSLIPFPAAACQGRLYHRLNEDYRPLHALCRFFLEHSGPGQPVGRHKMVPFLINMEQLYELFVAEWLKPRLPAPLSLKVQEHTGTEAVSAFIDLVVYNMAGGQAEYILDTKYKTPAKPANADIYQVVAYAEAKNCREAILIYPAPLPQPLDTRWGNIRVRSAVFALADDLAEAGRRFGQGLFW